MLPFSAADNASGVGSHCMQLVRNTWQSDNLNITCTEALTHSPFYLRTRGEGEKKLQGFHRRRSAGCRKLMKTALTVAEVKRALECDAHEIIGAEH